MQVIQKALTFDDVLLVPAHSEVLPKDVSLQTRLTRTIQLNIPLLSAAMDTVTEARLAIAIAQEGGIGILHKNLPPKGQAAEVAKVKRFESGVVKDPITISPDMTVRDVLKLTRQYRISGLPVVESNRVVGIVTNRDLRFENNLDQPAQQHHDAARTPGDREGRREPRRGDDAPAPASAGTRARDQRRLGVEGPHHGEGHPQVLRTPERVQGPVRPTARRRGHRRR